MFGCKNMRLYAVITKPIFESFSLDPIDKSKDQIHHKRKILI